MNTVDTFLPAIEHPRGLLMKLVYYFTRRQFGKVITPLKVHSARLPAAFGFFYSKIGKLDKELTLSPEFVLLIREQVARINVCEFCMDIARAFTIQASMNQAKFDALAQYRTSSLFTEAERAALALTEAVTRLSDRADPVPDAIWEEAARHYDEPALAALILAIATVNVWNRLNVTTRQVAGQWTG